jgi:hypothetical protein
MRNGLPASSDPREQLRTDLEFYARNCLRIKTKPGALAPFQFNRAQTYIHERLEEQKSRTGKVRALILKGRQQGCSTYVGARYYHCTTWRKGVKTFILTHEDQATQNLFEMVNRYHDNCPPTVKPSTSAANAKELFFDKLDSGYKVGTAGSKGVGRSSTIQLFHGSEVAFWPHADTHAAGVLQAVPDADGTEVILESTANGVGNLFHEKWKDAEAGDGDFIAVFVPWFWQDEYRKPVAADFTMTDEEQTYASAYGLDAEQIAWRRNKIIELKDEDLFKQEYPANAAEAFQMSGHDGFIKPADVVRARKAMLDGIGPLIVGADPARFGNDRFSLSWRQGRKVRKVESKAKLDTVAGANWIKQVVDEDRPARVFVDVGGIGAGVFDLLKSWGYAYEHGSPDPRKVVVPIDFGGSPQQPEITLPSGEVRPGPYNRRAEMWMRSRDWLKEIGGADIPDQDSLQADACGPGYHYNANSYLLLESKEHMRDVRKLRSPDEWDSVALTFAEPVAESSAYAPIKYPRIVRR